jgi:hypothetical protein
VRTFGYMLAAWVLFGIAMNGIVSLLAGGPMGTLSGVVAVAAIVWLVRSYRQGPGSSLVRELQRRLDALSARLPADPLASASVVNAWSVHLGDPEANERLRREYEAARGTVDEVQRELDHVRETGAVRRRELLEAKLGEVREYIRSIDVLAAREPELVDQAIAEHAEAAESIDQARMTRADVRALLAADEKLQGARDALRRDAERPLDAIRYAEEAEQIAASARHRVDLPSELESVRVRLHSAEDGLAAAVLRHAPSALAEIRGLPGLAREQLERASSGDPAALTATRATIQRIETHLAALDRAAATARPTLETAEAAVDAGVAHGGPAVARASELTTSARMLLREERPDWLEISSLANRALALLGEQQETVEDTGSARERARSAREDAWSWALTSSPRADEARAAAQQIDHLLDEASRLEGAGDSAGAAAVYLRVVSIAETAVEAASRTRLLRAG